MTFLRHYKKFILGAMFLFFSFGLQGVVFAEEGDGGPETYIPMTTIPWLTSDTSIGDFVNKVYMLLIVAGATFAVLKIAYAGVIYTMSDKVGSKENATHDIQGVLLGLVILVLPYIVLNTINSNLTNLDILNKIEPLPTESASMENREDRIDRIRRDTASSTEQLSKTCEELGKVLRYKYEPNTKVEFAAGNAWGTDCVEKNTVTGDEKATEQCYGIPEVCTARCTALSGTPKEIPNGNIGTVRVCHYTKNEKCILNENNFSYDCFESKNLVEMCTGERRGGGIVDDTKCKAECTTLTGELTRVESTDKFKCTYPNPLSNTP